jgi:hypothetical protein
VANSQSGQVQYNPAQVTPAEFHSFWDLLNPKRKNKMASLDPTTFGMGAALQFFYYHPELGSGFLRRLYGEMQITVSRDARQMTDWLASGKFSLCIRCNAGTELGKAIEQGLPIGSLDTESWKEGVAPAPPAELSGSRVARLIPMRRKCLSTGFFHAKDKSPHRKLGRPDAHNSRRVDIAKDDVDPYNRLEEGKKYFDLAKPEYQDLTPIFKVVREVLPQK